MPKSPKMNAKAPKKRGSNTDVETGNTPGLPCIPPSQWWGYKCQNVDEVVDLASTYGEMDSFARGFYTQNLTCGGLREKVNLVIKKGIRNTGAKITAIENVLDPNSGAGNLFAHKEHPAFVISSDIELRDIPNSGRGVVAKTDLKAGTIILVERPLVGILDVEWENEKWADAGADGAALAGKLAEAYVRNQEGLEMIYDNHHPSMLNFSEKYEVVDSESEDESDDEMPRIRTSELVAWYLDQKFKPTSLTEREQKRLRAVCKFNALGFYTNCEQLFHTTNFRGLTGSGLFAIASAFNHSCSPNVNRFSMGDITAFVVSDDVKKDEQLCISYIELELLCAERAVRQNSLNRDFTCQCEKCVSQVLTPMEKIEERIYMTVDCQLQAELALIPPRERIETVQNYRQMAEPLDVEEHDVNMDPTEIILLGKDAQELRTVIAHSYMHLRDWSASVKTWRRCAAFSVHQCPKNDESIPCFAIQTALCALADGDEKACLKYVSIARQAHGKAFGSESLMIPRMAREVECSFVPPHVKSSFVQLLGNNLTSTKEIVDWEFAPDEIPGAEDL